MKKILSLIFVNALIGSIAHAQVQPPATLANFVYVGTGCPTGSASAAIGKGGFLVNVHFTAFKVTANGNKGASKACELSMMLIPPQGYKISVHPATYIGTVDHYTHVATLDAGHDWAGMSTAPFHVSPLPKPKFGVVNVINTRPTNFAACNTPNKLHDNIKLTVSAGDMQGAELTDARYTINYQKCH